MTAKVLQSEFENLISPNYAKLRLDPEVGELNIYMHKLDDLASLHRQNFQSIRTFASEVFGRSRVYTRQLREELSNHLKNLHERLDKDTEEIREEIREHLRRAAEALKEEAASQEKLEEPEEQKEPEKPKEPVKPEKWEDLDRKRREDLCREVFLKKVHYRILEMEKALGVLHHTVHVFNNRIETLVWRCKYAEQASQQLWNDGSKSTILHISTAFTDSPGSWLER
ncbi:hypothetical protein ABW19_dt0205150 [Dactylella cylindrospora]|nr:hypothetical protein ABW19_dt0205150 [Dactylella cylindrospora]